MRRSVSALYPMINATLDQLLLRSTQDGLVRLTRQETWPSAGWARDEVIIPRAIFFHRKRFLSAWSWSIPSTILHLGTWIFRKASFGVIGDDVCWFPDGRKDCVFRTFWKHWRWSISNIAANVEGRRYGNCRALGSGKNASSVNNSRLRLELYLEIVEARTEEFTLDFLRSLVNHYRFFNLSRRNWSFCAPPDGCDLGRLLSVVLGGGGLLSTWRRHSVTLVMKALLLCQIGKWASQES